MRLGETYTRQILKTLDKLDVALFGSSFVVLRPPDEPTSVQLQVWSTVSGYLLRRETNAFGVGWCQVRRRRRSLCKLIKPALGRWM